MNLLDDITRPATVAELSLFLSRQIPAVQKAQALHSFVITSFRRPYRLKQCVESAAQQGITQIVISASGVRRCDLTMLQELGDRYPFLRFTLTSADLGCNENWLRGIYLARTPYITILHDDDQLAPNFYSEYKKSVEPHLAQGVEHVLWDGQVVQEGLLTNEIHRHLARKTGLYPSATMLSKLLEPNTYAISPVVQIFNRELALRTLKECSLNLTQPHFFPRPNMMVGNDLLLTLRHLQNYDQLLYIAKPLSRFGRWEFSESEWHRSRGSKKLLESYNATRAYFLENSFSSDNLPRNILHITNPYITQNESTARRHRIARWTWQELTERGNWIPLDIELSALNRNSRDMSDSQPVPFIKDLLDAGAASACDEDILLLTNSDTCISQNAFNRITDIFRKRDVGFSFRRDFHTELKAPVKADEISQAHWYMGCDLFAMTPTWWKTHRDSFPDFLLGRPGWDWALRALMGLTQRGSLALEGDVTDHSRFLDIPELIYHEKHLAMHEQPENRNHPSNRYNLRLAFEFFNRYRPYMTWTRLMRRQFPSEKEFRRGRLGILRQSYHRTRTSYRTLVRPQLSRRAPKLLQLSDRISAPIHYWLN